MNTLSTMRAMDAILLRVERSVGTALVSIRMIVLSRWAVPRNTAPSTRPATGIIPR